MKKERIILAVLFAIAFTSAGCKKDENVPAIEYRSQGFIKGNLSGATSGGKLEEKFSYTQYSLSSEGESYYYLLPDIIQQNDSIYSFHINRSDINKGGGLTLTFDIDELSDKPDNTVFQYSFRKETNTQLFYFYMENSQGEPNLVDITDFSFNPKTGRTTGSYTLSGSNNSTQKNAIVKGDFDVVLKRLVDADQF